MPFTLTLPKLSPTMQSGTIVKWLKQEGEFVEAGDVLIEVNTDKATVEYNALDSGWLRKIIIKEGQEGQVNQPIAIFTESKDESIENYKPQEISQTSIPSHEQTELQEEKEFISNGDVNEGKQQFQKGAPLPSAFSLSMTSFTPHPPLKDYEFDYPSHDIEQHIKASPLARKIAKEKGLDLTTVKGSGPQGRIMQHDLERAQPSGVVAFGHRGVPKLPPGSYEEEGLTPMRKVIGQRLQESKMVIPHFWIQQEINAQPIMELREQLKTAEIKMSVNDFILKGCALALRKHPIINSGYNGQNNTIIRFKTIDLAMAVSIPDGLITPIIRHADYKHISQISLEAKHLAKKARENKLDPTEYKGGSFTVSNLGMFGITQFQAIINPPQAAILAVGGVLERPIVKQGQIVPGKIMHLVLSMDHRVIDGAAGAEFLKTLTQYLENPALLLA